MMRLVRFWLALGSIALASGSASGQVAGDPGRNPVPGMVLSSLDESIRSQLLEPAEAQIKVLVHFPGGRGENGRICGEVIEPGTDGPRTRTFYSTYTRAGRVLTRFEDLPFVAFLQRDAVFRNCSPRL